MSSAAPTLVIVWLLGLTTVIATRYRAEWDTYVALHRWLAGLGVPDVVRHFDHVVLFAGAAFLGALLVTLRCGGTVFRLLALQRGRPGWSPMIFAALLPMVGGGALLGFQRWGVPDEFAVIAARFLSGVIRAPLAEELLFRGLLVAVPAVAALGWTGRAFWRNGFAAAALFASIHVSWKVEALADGWPNLLVTGLGGLWYAWLLARWRTLWVPMALHAGMNFGWLLAGAGGGAGGGGLIENLLRVATIAIATWWTIRKAPRAPGRTP